jgi:hypothetical protein
MKADYSDDKIILLWKGVEIQGETFLTPTQSSF